MKKKALWGSGVWAETFLNSESITIDVIIDNNRERIAEILNGLEIIPPSEIEDWNDYYIYVPFAYYKPVCNQLQQLGLIEGRDFTEWKPVLDEIGFNKSFLIDDYEKTVKEFDEHISSISRRRPILILWGQQTALDKLYNHDFLDNIIDNNKFKVILFSAKYKASMGYEDDIEFKNRFTVLKMPMILLHVSYVKDDESDALIEKEINNNELMYNTALQLKNQQTRSNINGCHIKAYYMEKFINHVIETLKPQIMMSQGSVLPLYEMIGHLGKQNGVKMVYVHPGVIPGTMSLDVDGEIGASLPALYPDKFSKLPVDSEELRQANRIINYIEATGANRKVLVKNDALQEIRAKISPNKKTILFAGQHDVCSYMIPHTQEAKDYYSPIFEKSIDAAVCLANLCERNGINFIYKPHPDYIREDEIKKLPSSAIYVEKINLHELIDYSDLVVTILSTTSYNALFRETPVLMIGYNWLKGSGCTYEAFEEKLIEDQMLFALKNGYTKEQKENFVRHIAVCLKYYVYDDMKQRDIRYGRGIPNGLEEIYLLKRLLTEEE